MTESVNAVFAADSPRQRPAVTRTGKSDTGTALSAPDPRRSRTHPADFRPYVRKADNVRRKIERSASTAEPVVHWRSPNGHVALNTTGCDISAGGWCHKHHIAGMVEPRKWICELRRRGYRGALHRNRNYYADSVHENRDDDVDVTLKPQRTVGSYGVTFQLGTSRRPRMGRDVNHSIKPVKFARHANCRNPNGSNTAAPISKKSSRTS